MYNISYYESLLKKRERNRDDMESFWDAKAKDFADIQKNPLEEIPKKLIKHLIDNDLINEKSTVLDIGGGSGRYAIPMAKIAKEVIITDISSKMLEYAKQNAEKEEIYNLKYAKLDLNNINIEDIEWNEKFDLVFASMCPAIKSEAGLDKMIKASKGSCYIGQYIEMTDNVSQAIMNELNLSNKNDPHNDREAVYGIFNILWLKGYDPKITYFKDITEVEYSIDEINERYGKKYASIAKEENKDFRKIISELSIDGKVTVKTKRTLAIIYWMIDNSNSLLLP